MQHNSKSAIDNIPLEASLPRLNIVFFCASKHLYDVAGQASTDRRLKKSKISIYSGSIPEATETYRDKPTPNLLVIESRLELINLLSELESLSGVCDETTKVIIVGHLNDVDSYREIIRQGVSEYLVTPTTPNRFIESLSSIYETAEEALLSPSVAFIGATGGAGTSVLAQNFASILANDHGIDTCMMDLDTAYGMTAMNWNVEVKKDLKSIISQGSDLDDNTIQASMQRVSDNLKLIGSPANPSYTIINNTENINILDNIFVSVRKLNDLVVMDIPYGELNILKQTALSSATHIYIVAVPTIRGLRNMSILYQTLCTMRPHDIPPKVIFTQLGNPDIVTINKKFIINNIGRDADHYISYAPEAIDRSIAESIPLSSVKDSDAIVADIQECVNQFLGRTTVKQEMNWIQQFFSDLLKH